MKTVANEVDQRQKVDYYEERNKNLQKCPNQHS